MKRFLGLAAMLCLTVVFGFGLVACDDKKGGNKGNENEGEVNPIVGVWTQNSGMLTYVISADGTFAQSIENDGVVVEMLTAKWRVEDGKMKFSNANIFEGISAEYMSGMTNEQFNDIEMGFVLSNDNNTMTMENGYVFTRVL